MTARESGKMINKKKAKKSKIIEDELILRHKRQNVLKSRRERLKYLDPTNEDFDVGVSKEVKFKLLETINKLHCTACGGHLGGLSKNERIHVHPMLSTLMCHSCHTFYNSGEFEKGDDGSELYCRWCGQGGQVYCCSDCPLVFCAECIKRNLGSSKIEEIENADDWKCFKCDPDCLKDLRSICWDLLYYRELQQNSNITPTKQLCNTLKIQDPQHKKACKEDGASDSSEYCKQNPKRKISKANESLSKKKDVKEEPEQREISKVHESLSKKKDVKMALEQREISKVNESKKKEPEPNPCVLFTKMTPTIRVKKFASLNMEDATKLEKKAQKRRASPQSKPTLLNNLMAITTCGKVLTQVPCPPLVNRMNVGNCNLRTVRYPNIPEYKILQTYSVTKPNVTPIQSNNYFNSSPENMVYCSTPVNDHINLSMENLTQVGNCNLRTVRYPNIPEYNILQTYSLTKPNVTPIQSNNYFNSSPENMVYCSTPVNDHINLSMENLTQVTVDCPTVTGNITQSGNPVTVNTSTGRLKLTVNPQMYNKMYRLPDGQILAINADANKPGGYSTDIVSVTEGNKDVSKVDTYTSKDSVVSASTPTPKNNRNRITKTVKKSKRNPLKVRKSSKNTDNTSRECDLNVPVEWYRYNLLDAADALEYSLSRLNKLKKEATADYLRTRSVNEMRSLHKTLESLLNTSTGTFNEIRKSLRKGLKEYTSRKVSTHVDPEILPDIDENFIFIDVNPCKTNINCENQEVNRPFQL